MDCKCKFDSITCNSNQKCDNDTCQCDCKKYRTCKKNCSWNPSTCICENSKYLTRIVDDPVYINKCDKYFINKCRK